jgi:hypothetical protein
VNCSRLCVYMYMKGGGAQGRLGVSTNNVPTSALESIQLAQCTIRHSEHELVVCAGTPASPLHTGTPSQQVRRWDTTVIIGVIICDVYIRPSPPLLLMLVCPPVHLPTTTTCPKHQGGGDAGIEAIALNVVG